MKAQVFQYPSKVEPFSQDVLNPFAWWQPASTPSRRLVRWLGGSLSTPFVPFLGPGVFEDKIVLGQNQSIAVGMQAALGGGQTW